MFKKILSFPKGSSSPALSGVEGKAEAILTRGAYSQYVSTAKGRHLSVRAASAKPGNAASGFFHSFYGEKKLGVSQDLLQKAWKPWVADEWMDD